jgi:hypothetical protein
MSDRKAAPDNGMHPTRKRGDFISNLAGGRVRPGVRR